MNSSARRRLHIIVAFAGLLLAPTAYTLDAFLQVPGIDGDSVDATHRTWIDVQSFGFNATARVCQGLSVVKRLDSASPLLSAAVVNGDVFPQMLLELRKAGGNGGPLPFWTLTLKDVSILSITQNVDGALNTLTEQLQLKPLTIEMTFRPLNPKGTFDTPIASTLDCKSAAAPMPEDTRKDDQKKSDDKK